MTPHAVFFDVGNTLLYPYPSVSHVCREILLESGRDLALDEIDRLMPLVDAYYEDRYKADDTFWTDEERTSEVWAGMYSLLCKELGMAEDATSLARRVYEEFGKPERWRPYADVVPAFERLRALDVRLGIISNWDTRLEPLLLGMGLGQYLETIVSSAAVGLHKPDPRIFDLACARLDVEPSEAAHVGDHHYSDIVGATAVGMSAVRIDRHGAASDVGAALITTLDDLDAVLGFSP